MSDATDLLAAVRSVVAALDRHGIRYFVTGSLASSVHGEFRATNDIDLVVALEASQLAPLLNELSRDFITDIDQAVSALAAGSTFNLIHGTTYLKVDLFPCVSAFDAEATRRAEAIAMPGDTATLRFATREDILLAKLRWYRLGGETSETQQRDIQRLVALNRGEFDERYLQRWAAFLGVSDLLERFLGG